MGWYGLDRDQLKAVVNTVMNLRVPYNTGKFLSSCTFGSFSRRAQLHEWASETDSIHKYYFAFNFRKLDPVFVAARVSSGPCFQSPGDIWRLDKLKWKWTRCGHAACRKSLNTCAIFQLSKHNLEPSLGTLHLVSRRTRPYVYTTHFGFCYYREQE
jgi:hypothetical protein